MTLPDPQFPTFRDMAEYSLPRWLKKPLGFAKKYLYALMVHLDILGDGVIFGVRRKFPGYDEFDSLHLTGKDRKIERGRFETDEVYATRQLRWLDDHSTRGGPYALLNQIFAHYAPNQLTPNNFDDTIATLIYRNGQRFQMYADGTITRSTVAWTSPNVGPPEVWSHWWLGLQIGSVPDDGIWSDPGTWDDGGVWDYGFTPAEVADFRLIPKTWGNAHSIGHIALMNSDNNLAFPAGLAIISVD